jgi:hypothetical protein
MARLAQVPAQRTPHVTKRLKLQGVGTELRNIFCYGIPRFPVLDKDRSFDVAGRMVVRCSGMLQGSKRLKRAGSKMVSAFATVSISLDGIGIDISGWIVNLDFYC